MSTGLDNVDQTVSKLKEQLNVNTKEAAEIEVRLNKAKETISAAEDLVVKLDEEYSRWGEQVKDYLNLLFIARILDRSFITNWYLLR